MHESNHKQNLHRKEFIARQKDSSTSAKVECLFALHVCVLAHSHSTYIFVLIDLDGSLEQHICTFIYHSMSPIWMTTLQIILSFHIHSYMHVYVGIISSRNHIHTIYFSHRKNVYVQYSMRCRYFHFYKAKEKKLESDVHWKW